MKTQYQHFNESQQKLFDKNRAFMDMVNDPINPMTNDDLIKLIRMNPERYGMYMGFIGKLKT